MCTEVELGSIPVILHVESEAVVLDASLGARRTHILLEVSVAGGISNQGETFIEGSIRLRQPAL